MEALLYFLIWAVLIAFMMRFGCGAHVMGQRQKSGPETGSADPGQSGLRWIAPARDRDPVCGKTVTTANARPSVYDGNVYYFCSRECREAFEVAPHLYAGDPTHGHAPAENSHA